MRASRYAVRAASAALLGAVLVGCSSSDKGDSSKPAPSAPASAERAAKQKASPSPEPSSGPVLNVGQTGTYDVGETDEYGENYKVTSTMRVTVVGAKYVTAADIDTTNEPENGQYVILSLTLKNVGRAPAEFSAYGLMEWEDDQTAAQDATTLEGVGEGPDLDRTYKPGQSVTGKLVLDVVRRGGKVSYVGGESPESGPVFTVNLPK